MVKSKGQPKPHTIHHYLVIGRHAPTSKNPTPKIYKMRIFANDPVRAKCKFWYFLKKLDKVKKASGEILACHEIFDQHPSKVKTFGIFGTYKSKYGYHNFYKEFRSTTLNGAVDQLYCEMVGRHKAQRESLVVVRTTEVDLDHLKEDEKVEDKITSNYLKPIVKREDTPKVVRPRFPLLHKRIRVNPAYRKVFRPSRPSLIC